MKYTHLLFILPALFAMACSQKTSNHDTDSEVEHLMFDVEIMDTEVYEYRTGYFGDEQNVIIAGQPKKSILSELVQDTSTNNEVVYRYQSLRGYLGVEQVELEVYETRAGTKTPELIKYISISIRISHGDPLPDTDSSVDSDSDNSTDSGSDNSTDSGSDSSTDSDVDSDPSVDSDTGEVVKIEDIVCNKGTFKGDVYVRTLQDLQEIYGYTEIDGYVHLEGVESLEGLFCLERITMDLTIDDIKAETLKGLHNLRVLGYYLYVFSNDNLTSMTDLGNLTTPPGVVRIQYNPKLIDIDLGFLQVIEELTFMYNRAVQNLNLSSLLAINKQSWSRLEIMNNEALASVDLSNLEQIKGTSMRISYNPLLAEITLPAATILDAYVTIDSNETMHKFSTTATLMGSLSFYDSPITTLEVPNLKTLRTDLNISDFELTQLQIESLENVGENVRIYVNPNLTSISLPLLQTVGEDFELWGNYLLTCNPDTLKSQFTATTYDICGNAPLSTCGPDSCL